MLFYVDTCIYLNLWQDEGDFSRHALVFFDWASDHTIYYSRYILRELEFILSPEEFNEKKRLFLSLPNLKNIEAHKGLFAEARRIESEIRSDISFYDIIHMLLAKGSGSVLVTRDRKLLMYAGQNGVRASRPEELSR